MLHIDKERSPCTCGHDDPKCPICKGHGRVYSEAFAKEALRLLEALYKGLHDANDDLVYGLPNLGILAEARRDLSAAVNELEVALKKALGVNELDAGISDILDRVRFNFRAFEDRADRVNRAFLETSYCAFGEAVDVQEAEWMIHEGKVHGVTDHATVTA